MGTRVFPCHLAVWRAPTDGTPTGIVLAATHPAARSELSYGNNIEDHEGLGYPIGHGLWVWEGTASVWAGGGDYGEELESDCEWSGVYRRPRPEELQAIGRGQPPWLEHCPLTDTPAAYEPGRDWRGELVASR